MKWKIRWRFKTKGKRRTPNSVVRPFTDTPQANPPCPTCGRLRFAVMDVGAKDLAVWCTCGEKGAQDRDDPGLDIMDPR